MKRFEIHNLKFNTRFAYEEEEALPWNDQWGKDAHVKPKAACDAWELANGTDAGGGLWNVPKSYVLLVTDITAEVAAEEAKRAARKLKLKGAKDLKSTDDVIEYLKALSEHLGFG